MREISQYNAESLRVVSSQEQQISQRQQALFRQRALRAVTAENRLASVDKSEISQSAASGGSFKFDFSSETKISWEGSYNFQSGPPAAFESSFSLSVSISQSLSVEFGAGTTADAQQISGSDFSFDRQGLLKMLEDLIEQLNAQDRPQLDLGGELDGRALELLQQLGLIDDEGKATPLLQLLSDYAGLNRFQAGQQVNAKAGTSYGTKLSSAQLGWQGWNQRLGATGDTANAATQVTSGVGGANTISGSNVGGDVNIDDRDTVNINITLGD